MTIAVSVDHNRSNLGDRLRAIVAQLGEKRASRRDHTQARRTALAMSEEARINAQMRYRRMRYRHMAR